MHDSRRSSSLGGGVAGDPANVPAASWTSRHLGSFQASFAAPRLTEEEEEVVQRFSELYYHKMENFAGLHTIVLSWMGYELFKCPLDLWIYQELIVRTQPDLIVEIGTYKGGSALFMACMRDLAGRGEILTVDIDGMHDAVRPRHPRIRYLTGSSIDEGILRQVEEAAAGKSSVMVILDGDHTRDHVLAELRLYNRFVAPGGYLIVEDTNINGHPAYPDFGPGPWEAVDAFLAEDKNFYSDLTCQRFMLTMNPRGFLRRAS